MRRKLAMFMTGLMAIIGVFSYSLSSVGAVDVTNEVCNNSTNKPDICADFEATKGEDGTNPLYGPDGIITRAVNGLSLLAGLIAVIIIILAGIKMSMSAGDSGKVKSARDQIIYAVVGLVIAGVAQAMVRLLLNRIGQ